MGALLSYQEGIIPMILDELKSKKEQLLQRVLKLNWLHRYSQNLPDSSGRELERGIKLKMASEAGGKTAGCRLDADEAQRTI